MERREPQVAVPAPGAGGASALAAVRPLALQGVASAAAPVLLFAALTALAGQVRVPLPFTPVPLTLQVIPVLLAAALLGPVRGPASQLVFLAAGALGAPVFTAGAGGAAYLLGPTGGYLVGFAAAALVVGRLLDIPGPAGFLRIAGAMTAGTAVIFILGVTHLAVFTGGSWTTAFRLGSLPFLPGAALKIVAAASMAAGWQRLRRPVR